MSNNDKGAEMKTWTIARNVKTTAYEIHKAGCKHTALTSKFEVMVDVEFETGAAAEWFERKNEGCRAALGPCAK